MKKKRNILKRNSGFVAGCVLAAGASFVTADMVMSDMSNVLLPSVDVTEKGTEKALDPETTESRAYETDAFTVTAAGDIIRGVEKETETEKQTEKTETETRETDENGNVISVPETDADGNPVSSEGGETGDSGSENEGDGSYTDSSYSEYDDGSYSDGSYSDSSWDDGNSGYDQPIEIYDPGNGDYTYNSGGDTGSGSGSGSGDWGGGSGGSSGSESGGSSGQETGGEPSDLILPGISTHYIDESELYNFSAGQIRLIRNEIFALHGRIFESQDLRDYFSQKSWYVPTYAPDDFDANMFYYLNDYEEANLKVILNYEAALAGY